MEIQKKLFRFKYHILVTLAVSLIITSLIFIAPRFLTILAYFWPLFLSTALFLVAVVVFGRTSFSGTEASAEKHGEGILDYVAGQHEPEVIQGCYNKPSEEHEEVAAQSHKSDFNGMGSVLDEKDAADWVYRGEGGANIVLSYTGSSPIFFGKVVRIQKALRKKSSSVKEVIVLTAEEKLLWETVEDLASSPNREIAAHVYVQHVMTPLLGSKHVDAGKRVPVSKEFLELVEKNLIYQRPTCRVDAANIDTRCDYALIISDHTVFPHGPLKDPLPCISVEIKPKCGFLPMSKFIGEGNSIKRRVSRFKMHQALKLSSGEISELSEYNPLDLFSGSTDRIFEALRCLYTTPQNNFRVFLNGSLIFGGLGGGTKGTSLVIGDAFDEILKDVIHAEKGVRTMTFLQLVGEAIYKSGVLDRLLKVQKRDTFDIEGAIHAYYNIVSEPCAVCRELGENKLSDLYASLHSIPLDESFEIVKDYLISATAKDCSLMISFRPRETGDSRSLNNVVHLDSTDQYFDYKAYFLDLDLKPLKKMEHYYHLDQRIVKNYIQTVKTEDGSDKDGRFEAYGSTYQEDGSDQDVRFEAYGSTYQEKGSDQDVRFEAYGRTYQAFT